MIHYEVGDRTTETAIKFMRGLHSRLSDRVQISTDGLKFYIDAVEDAFGSEVDFAQTVKMYGESEEKPYGRAVCTGVEKRRRIGNPDPVAVSTSHVERSNLTMRMGMRRYTQMSNGFSKKIENHWHMLSLFFLHYNFCRPHMSLGGISPAMEAGLSHILHDLEWIVDLIDARAPKPNRPLVYRTRRISSRVAL